MNYGEEVEKANIFFAKCVSLIAKKAHDYANNKDCFSNFRKTSGFLNQPFYAPYLTMMAIKLARLVELFGGKQPKFESIQDTLMDLANYSCLLALEFDELNKWKEKC